MNYIMITVERLQRVDAVNKVLGKIDTTPAGLTTPPGLMLRRLEAFHPTPISRADLLKLAGISVKTMGGISAYASFHYKVERINDELHRFGWEIARISLANETYGLVKWSKP